jgi:hypothetical protein
MHAGFPEESFFFDGLERTARASRPELVFGAAAAKSMSNVGAPAGLAECCDTVRRAICQS